MSFIFIEYNPK